MASPHVKVFTDANWNDEVMASAVPVLVDFWAPWCGPCKAIAPEIEAIAETYAGRAKVGKVDVSENTKVAAQFQVRSIPTMIVIKDGKVIDQQMGMMTKEKLGEMIDKAL